MKKFIGVLSAVVLTFACAPKERFAKAVAVGMPATVTVYVAVSKGKERGLFSGSGVFVSPTGHVLTCAHLFAKEPGVKIGVVTVVTNTGDTYGAELLGVDANRDLGLLKINDTTPYVKIISPLKVSVGQEVIAIGSPLGLDRTVTHGIISATGRDLFTRINLIQTDTLINHGNSGGPLLSLDGGLVGINVMFMPNSPGFTLAVSSDQILQFLSKYQGLESVFKGA